MNQKLLNPITIQTQKTEPTHTIIWMHGLGANAHDFTGIISELNLPPHINIKFIFPNAPVRPITINNGFSMQGWFDIKSLNDLQDEDEKGIRESGELINQLIKHEIREGINSKHIYLAGFSQGSAMALFTGLRYREPLGGIIALSGYLPLEDAAIKEKSTANHHIPIFMAHGKIDTIVPLKLAEHSKSILIKSNFAVEWYTYNMGHELCSEEIIDIAHWIKKNL